MKRKTLSFCLALVFVFCQFATPAYAILDESKYLSSYSTDVIARDDSKLAIEVSVHGTGMMDSIGIQKITINAYDGNHWSLAGGFYKTDEGMTRENSVRYGNTIYFSAVSGTYYQVFVTIFAEDSSGSDSRTEVHYVTAK